MVLQSRLLNSHCYAPASAEAICLVTSESRLSDPSPPDFGDDVAYYEASLQHSRVYCQLQKSVMSLSWLVLATTLGGAAALGFCNDKDLSCASWAKNGECEGENSETARPA